MDTSYIPVSTDDVAKALEELNTALPKFGLTAEKLPATVRIYRSGLTDFDRETLTGAVQIILRTCDHFPTLKLLRETCRTWLKHNRTVTEWKGEQDGLGRDIACRVCRSVGRFAVLERADGSQFVRCIAPCDPERHHGAQPIVPMPPNFVQWYER